ncbi:efflux RND transporter periplasmic adaptor subunit [Flavobacterium sp. JP2137]|uniref:efflux RND transporter periplasmic adaptor subunit n=1 Tax=Flavobacterium sp. JP2137 TaxID=3414510 RepID=UPI003D2FC72B
MKFIHYTFLGMSLLALSCNSDKKAPEAPKMEMGMKPSMETVVLKKSNPLTYMQLTGELIPDKQTAIYAKVTSFVKTLSVDIGSKVVQGQVLMVLEAPEIQAQLAAAHSKWKAQEAIYIATKSNYDRLFRANETEGAVAQDAIDQIVAKKAADQAQLVALKSAYEEVQVMAAYLVIRAPFDGIIAQRNVELGSYVGPSGKGSDMPLLLLQDNKKLRLSLSVPEAQAAYLNLNDTIRFVVKAVPQMQFVAKISRKSGALDPKLRSEKIEADIANPTGALKALMVAEATIPLKSAQSSFFVPKPALVESGVAHYVVQVKEGKTKHIVVAKGRMMPDMVEVFGDLNEGDMILKMATEEIEEGMAVPAK